MLALVLASTLAPFSCWIELADEGVTTLGALRVAGGQVPHRDFFSLIPPVSYLILAAAFKVLGPTVVAVRLTGALLGVLLVLATRKVAERLLPGSPFALMPVAILAVAGTAAWPFPSHHWAGNLLVTASVLAGLRACEAERPARWAGLAGGLAGLSALALQDLGGAFVLLASALWLPRLGAERRRVVAKGWLGGVVFGGALPLLVLVLWSGPGPVFADLVRYPLETYWDTPGNRVGVTAPLQELAAQWRLGQWASTPFFGVAASTVGLLLFSLPFLSPLPAVFCRRKAEPESAPAVGLLVAGAVAFALCAARRWAPINLIWGAGLPAVCGAWLLARWYRRASVKTRWIPATISVVVGAACLWVGLSLAARALDPARRYPVKAAAGTLYDFSATMARDIQGLIDAVEAKVPPGSPLLCREVPLVNFLTRRPNPSRYDLFGPTASTADQTSQVLKQMEAERWPWVVVPVRPLQMDQPFDRYLRERYRVVWSNARFALCQRAEVSAKPRPSPDNESPTE